jgi:hypothetical protein
MFLPRYGPMTIADWSIIVQCHLLVKLGFSICWSVVEMGILSTLKRLLMESAMYACQKVLVQNSCLLIPNSKSSDRNGRRRMQTRQPIL